VRYYGNRIYEPCINFSVTVYFDAIREEKEWYFLKYRMSGIRDLPYLHDNSIISDI